jgi:hypothetical protein
MEKLSVYSSIYSGVQERCDHVRLRRLGIQRMPFPPYRVYLLVCRSCGTTVATQSIRRRREGERRIPA